MDKLVVEICEKFIKPRNINYPLTDTETSIIKIESEFKINLNLKQIQQYEELEFLKNKLKYEKMLELIEFAINYSSKKDME